MFTATEEVQEKWRVGQEDAFGHSGHNRVDENKVAAALELTQVRNFASRFLSRAADLRLGLGRDT